MKKIIAVAILFISIISCDNGNDTSNTSADDISHSDTTGIKNPDGIVNSNVISTDSSAWDIDTTGKKHHEDSSNKKN
jgi:hypothetical protein